MSCGSTTRSQGRQEATAAATQTAPLSAPTHHSVTHSSQKTCEQPSFTGALIASQQMGHGSPPSSARSSGATREPNCTSARAAERAADAAASILRRAARMQMDSPKRHAATQTPRQPRRRLKTPAGA